VKEILAPGGLFYLTLADGQAHNWCLSEMVSRQGFQQVKSFSFVPSDFPYYQMKRHQVGKSFKQRITSHETFVLTLSSSSSVNGSDDKCSLKSDIFLLMTEKNSIGGKESESSGVGNVDQKHKQAKPKKQKKRKMVEMTAGMYEQVSVSTESKDVESESCYRCTTCRKEFPTEQGARTHVYVEHVLEKSVAKYQLRALESVALTPVSTESLQIESEVDSGTYRCSFCTGSEKVYTSVDALYQHVTAKHPSVNRSTSISTTCDVKSSDIAPKVEASPSKDEVVKEECVICGTCVTSQVEHLASLKPPQVKLLECETCGRTFQSERSILQHSRFCQLDVAAS
jgi:DNA-directed RNA polymerase subunit M/transcription elongation factor TFIIS